MLREWNGMMYAAMIFSCAVEFYLCLSAMIPACALTIRGIARERVDGVVYAPCVGTAFVVAGDD
jgi:hypothetical protein